MNMHNSFTPNELINEDDLIEVCIESYNSVQVGICDYLSLDCRGLEEIVFWCPEEKRWINDE